MISLEVLQSIVMRANLAPSVHNVQPARWRMDGDDLLIAADLSVGLTVGDPKSLDAGLSCGAAVEATLMALGDVGFGAEVEDLWKANNTHVWPGHRLAARLTLKDGRRNPLAPQLENRFTWRAPFSADPSTSIELERSDSVTVTKAVDRDWLAELNDEVSLEIMDGKSFRHELLSWMRLSPGHPRYAFDGLGREAMLMPKKDALVVRWALGPFWPILRLFGATRAMTAEAEITKTAPLIACFHRPESESPVTTGRAYLRLWLEATQRGAAGWPMAALSDSPETSAQIKTRFSIPQGRRLVQVIRFGKATGPMPPKARRPIQELLF